MQVDKSIYIKDRARTPRKNARRVGPADPSYLAGIRPSGRALYYEGHAILLCTGAPSVPQAMTTGLAMTIGLEHTRVHDSCSSEEQLTFGVCRPVPNS